MRTYRVKINGFRVVQETYDDILQRDGKRDEVQISVITAYLDGDGKIDGEVQERVTPIMGDTWRLDNRIQAGTASDRGGLRTGDSFPADPMPWLPATPVLPDRFFPPCVIWEGELPDDGSQSVLLTVSILEHDFGTDFWTLVSGVLKSIDDEFGKKAKAAFGTLFPVSVPVFDAVSLGIQTAAALPRYLGAPGTRPIGMITDPDDPGKYIYTPKTLALNAATAAKIVKRNYMAPKAGVFSWSFRDDARLGGGHYEVYFQVEDISQSSSRWTHLGTAHRVRSLTTWDDGPSLIAVTDNGTLQFRSMVEADIPWTSLGSAPIPAGLASSSGMFWCAGRDNNLYVKPSSPFLPWQRVGHANDVRAMTYAAGHLYCATSTNVLWRREPVFQDINWQQIGHANDVVSMTTMGADLICATTDNQIWRRPASAGNVNWTPIGTAPATVTGLAYQQNDNSLWVAIHDGRLLKFHP